jgi:hypothetical protein
MSWLADKAAWLLGIIVAIGGFFFYAKRQGKKEEQDVETERALQQAKESNDIEAQNRALSDAAARAKLRGDQRE